MKSKFLILIAFSVIVSCASTSQEKLMDNTDVVQVFSEEETAALSMIIQLFDSTVVKSTGRKTINKAYHEYFDLINNSEDLNALEKDIGLASSNNTNLLIQKLKQKGVFNEIWSYSYGLNYESKDTVSVRLELNSNGKYMQLLELLAKHNNYTKEYVSAIQQVGSIGPGIIAGMMKTFYRGIDFQREVHRLVWAIHYITILSEKEYKGEKEIQIYKYSGAGSTTKELSLTSKETSLKLSYEFYTEPDELIVYDQNGKELHHTGMRATTEEVSESINIYDVTKLVFKIESKETNSKWKFSVTVE